ncbi:MAG TPA: hypothetical protein PK995_07070 [Bacteroidia bacterium]|nr:hypothetical protein [Bacteroidia bacterium]
MKSVFYFLIMFLFIIGKGFTQKSPKNPIRFSKLSTSILLQRYNYNTFHSSSLSTGISYMIGFHQEFALNKLKQKDFLSFGVEYLYHSYSFRSYYFTQDTFRYYNGQMNYSYSIKQNELCIPLLYKHNFSNENNDLQGIYFQVGYVYRLLLPSTMYVSYDGQNIDVEKFHPTFKNPVVYQNGNSYAHLSIGFQKNNPQGKMKFYFEIFGRYGFSPYFIKTYNTPNNLYFQNYFLGVCFGIKWRR